MAGTGASPGERRGGRAKGTPNKATASKAGEVADVAADQLGLRCAANEIAAPHNGIASGPPMPQDRPAVGVPACVSHSPTGSTPQALAGALWRLGFHPYLQIAQ